MDDIRIEKAIFEDINSASGIYDAVHDYFSDNVNYCFPNWQKGKYPVRRDAWEAIQENSLFILKHNGKIKGSVIIDNKQHAEYRNIPWGISCDDKEVMVIHTLVVHPSCRQQGLAELLLITVWITAVRQVQKRFGLIPIIKISRPAICMKSADFTMS